MEKIDWSKAPEGATHFAPAFGSFNPLWARLEDGVFKFHSTDPNSWRGWYSGAQPGDGEEFIERPSDNWTGPGLPPVGTVREYTAGVCEKWYGCKIIAYYGEHVWLRTTGANRDHVKIASAFHFRPIRPPEQIAAEEREKAIEEMWDHVKLDVKVENALYSLYAAGYRKQPTNQPQEDK